MKKRKLVVMLICLMLISSVALSACSLIKVNEERQANRVMATVTVDLAKEYTGIKDVLGNEWDYTVSLDITRRELLTTVNYTLSYMSQLYAQMGSSYDYDLDSILDAGLENLIAQKYRIINAMGEMLLAAKNTGRYDALYMFTDEYKAVYGNKIMPEGVLTIAERYDAVSTVNKQFDSQIESLTEETENTERNNEKSEANLLLSDYYKEGYFVKRVAVAHKTEEGYADGLYKTTVVDDADDKTADLDYTKVYVKVTLTASEKEDAIVYIPVEEEDFKMEEDSDAAATGKYFKAKKATVGFSGRVYAEKTEDNDNGYEIESFTSKAAPYTLVTPRSAYKATDKDETTALDNLRYVTRKVWANKEAYTDEMKELAAEPFKSILEEYASKEQKDAYRQLRSTFNSNNIGYTETDPGKDSDNYINYKYYNGLKYYYDSQFNSKLLSAKEYELTNDTEETNEKVVAEYNALVEKDKANYENLSKEEQVKKFFSTISSDLSSVYYVPIDALTTITFEVDPTDKKYSPLFTDNGAGGYTYNDMVTATTEDGKTTYTMKYAYLNDDGTYTINMFYVTHILFSFDNVPGLSDTYKNAIADFSSEDSLQFVKMYAEALLKIAPQLPDYLAKYEERAEENYDYSIDDVFGEEKNYTTIIEEVNTELAQTYDNSGKSYISLLNKFIELMEMYNDDSGKLSGSGYLVATGDMENSWYADFTAVALNMYYNLLNKNKPTTGYDETDSVALEDLLQDAYSDYGVHKMVICFDPLNHVSIDENGGIGIDTELKLDGTTWRKKITDDLSDALKEKLYSDWEEKFTDDKIDNHTYKNEKNYKALLKDLKD